MNTSSIQAKSKYGILHTTATKQRTLAKGSTSRASKKAK